jgi:putative endonuclease
MIRPGNSHRGRMADASGRAAEAAVARDYDTRGFTVLSSRWRGKSGELDLVTEHAGHLVFVEVKSGDTHAAAAERVSTGQITRIYAAAQEYLAIQGLSQDTDCRFDVALVDGSGQIAILENALAA